MEEGNCDSQGLSWTVVLEEEEEDDDGGGGVGGGGSGGGDDGLHLCCFVFVSICLCSYEFFAK